MRTKSLNWGQLKEFAQDHNLTDDTEIWVEVQAFDEPDSHIPTRASSGRVDEIERTSDKRVILTHIT